MTTLAQQPPETKTEETSAVKPEASEVLAWRAQHEERFRSPDGWLALIGMHWLKDGSYSIGSAEDCDLRLPTESTADIAGRLQVRGNVVLFTGATGVVATLNGEAAGSATLEVDSLLPEADCPDKLRLGDRIGLQLVRRSGKLALRVRDSQSPSIQKFEGKSWFDESDVWRFDATFTPYDPPRPRSVVNIKGDETPGTFAGFVTFVRDGHESNLDVVQESDGALFITFRDTTSGKSTYGPGRFLDTEPPVDGRVVLDFNKCYSPPCAWSEFTLCPLPPRQNHLSFAIEVGERLAEK